MKRIGMRAALSLTVVAMLASVLTLDASAAHTAKTCANANERLYKHKFTDITITGSYTCFHADEVLGVVAEVGGAPNELGFNCKVGAPAKGVAIVSCAFGKNTILAHESPT